MAAIDMSPSGAADHLICGRTTYPVPESIVTYCGSKSSPSTMPASSAGVDYSDGFLGASRRCNTRRAMSNTTG